jgi:hypothetical protein
MVLKALLDMLGSSLIRGSNFLAIHIEVATLMVDELIQICLLFNDLIIKVLLPYNKDT